MASEFDRLSRRGSFWRGRWPLPGFTDEFDLAIRAGADGPDVDQRALLQRVSDPANPWAELAAAPMAALIAESTGESVTAETVWDTLRPGWIEFAGPGYAADGAAYVLVGFVHRQLEEFAPAVELRAGEFARVVSGT